MYKISRKFLESFSCFPVSFLVDWDGILYPFGTWALDEELMGQAGRETQANLACDFPYYGYRFNYTFVRFSCCFLPSLHQATVTKELISE